MKSTLNKLAIVVIFSGIPLCSILVGMSIKESQKESESVKALQKSKLDLEVKLLNKKLCK